MNCAERFDVYVSYVAHMMRQLCKCNELRLHSCLWRNELRNYEAIAHMTRTRQNARRNSLRNYEAIAHMTRTRQNTRRNSLRAYEAFASYGQHMTCTRQNAWCNELHSYESIAHMGKKMTCTHKNGWMKETIEIIYSIATVQL